MLRRRSDAPTHRRTGLLGASVRLCVGASLAACASSSDPPGGPPDLNPPQVAAVSPDSGAVLSELPERVDIVFDEVVNERIAAQRSEVAYAVILSPDTTVPRVGWHRNRLTVRPRDGFKPGRVYRVELLPVLTDLRQNRLRRGRTIVFSTGPDIPSAALSGTLVDWPAARAVTNGLIEAVLLPESLPYRALTDSVGNFTLAQVPPGEYLVYGTVDQSNDRRRGVREAFDTVRVTLSDSAGVELFAFVRDTTAPRLRLVDVVDTLTIRVTFDRPLDPTAPLDTSQVHLALQADSTTLIGVDHVLTARGLDSLRAADAAARAARQAAERDSAATARGALPPADTAGRAPRPAPPGGGARAAADTARAAPPRDSTRAQRMLARRPPPTDARVLRLAAPLTPGERYLVFVVGVRSLAGVTGSARSQLLVPRPRAPADSSRARRDSAAARP